jgi:hypothetical protein
MSDLSPLSGVKLKSDFGAVRAAFDPNRTFVAARIVNSVDPITFGANSAHHKGDEFIQPRVMSRLCKPQFAGSSLLRNLPHQ